MPDAFKPYTMGLRVCDSNHLSQKGQNQHKKRFFFIWIFKRI